MTPEDRREQLNRWLEQARVPHDAERMSDDRLTEVFDLVKDPEHWKNPIDARVPVGTCTVGEIETAVAWFCGGYPEVWVEGDVIHVRGAGYWGWGMDGV